tara:strand:+ start:574 stop:1416 length:843 start_codon:yes stop_codon:yes gene_type:complete
MIIENAIQKAVKILKKNNIATPFLDSELLMSETISKDRSYILLNPRKNLTCKHLSYFEKLIELRSKGEPIAYLVKKKDFWNYEFVVKNGILIPRPETEIIVQECLKLAQNKKCLKVLDVGVGSGCILLSILKEKKNFYGVGIDLSKKCIDLSKINSHRLAIKNRVKFYKSNIDNFNYGKYDLIISNPPYVKKYDYRYLKKDIKNFEPRMALDGGLDGLSEIRKLINKSSELIKRNGKLILEIGFDQKIKVLRLLKNEGFFINKVVKDFANNDRCIIGTKI